MLRNFAEKRIMKNLDQQKTTSIGRPGQIYADLLNDFMFKRIFGSEANKDVLIAFLNRMLPDMGIEDVTFIPTYHLGESSADRQAVFDLSCQCKNGSTFIVEMQRARQRHFRERALFYTSYPIMEQGRLAREQYESEKVELQHKGLPVPEFKWDYYLSPVIMVSILNFSLDHSPNWPQHRYYSSYSLREETYGERMTNNLRYVFLELGRFRKEVCELSNAYDKWMYLFCHIQDMTERPEGFVEIEFERLFNLAKIANFTAEELRTYHNSLNHMCDYANTIDYAREEGLERGIEKGIERGRVEGRAEERADTILKMYSKGMTLKDISSLLDISETELKSIIDTIDS